jgi:UDP-N-acetylmuramyl tripeptide synthase
MGRMQKIAQLQNNAQIFIDFAHSPDALENVLKQARSMLDNKKLSKEISPKLVVLFGCGGDRDRQKRPIMGKIASELADVVILSDDNPRSENPQLIRKEILSGCLQKNIIEINDRRLAIIEAIKILNDNDILILAGKGHEKYQIIGDKKIDFDEEQIVKNAIK